MSMKTCLITGATNGIGKAAAQRIAEASYRMVLVGRDEKRGAAAVDEIRGRTGNDAIDFMRADLSLVREAKEIARRFRRSHDRLDLLVNNAGAVFHRRQITPEGFERTLALNHLAYFVLTTELIELLESSAPARVVNVSSGAHRWGRLVFDDLHLANGYSALRAYGNSKLSNILFTRELARRLKGKGITANSMHPGFVATGFALNNGRLAGALMTALRPFARTPAKGADTLVHLALSPEVEGMSGEYFFNRRPVRPRRRATSDEAARRLWEASERMIEASTKAVA